MTQTDKALVQNRRARRRRARQQAIARDDILDAAAEAFGERGYRATTMGDIAQRAGYSAGSLYTYFSGKQELFRELGRRVVERMLTILEVSEPGGSLEERLVARLQPLMRFLDQHWSLLSAFEAAKWSADIDEDPEERVGIQRLVAERIMVWLTQEREHLPNAPPEVLVSGLLGLIEAYMQSAFRAGGPPGLGERTAEMVHLFLYGACGKA